MRLLRRLWLRQPLLPRSARVPLALVLGAGAVATFAARGEAPAQQPGGGHDGGGTRHGQPGVQDYGVPRSRLVSEGRRLFEEGCSSCHGMDARGLARRGPALHGVGELSADFYLRTGRMPIEDPEDEPRRTESPYSERQVDSLIAYVGSLSGPPIPEVDSSRGDLAEGLRVFGEKCMGCHQVVGQGGITTRAWIPDLQKSQPIDVAEAVKIGPYVMPHFRGQLSQREVDSLARYVEYTADPEDRGGWGIGHIGPVPEGMVTWLLGAAALLLTIRLIGERTTDEL